MMRFFVLIGALLIMTGCIGAGKISTVKPQGENYFPKMEGIDLLGEMRQLPESFEGKLNIVTVAFEREHQKDVNEWIALADEIMQEHPDVKFYEIPVIYEINAPYRFWVNNGMRSGILEPEARERTITVFTDREKFTGIMNMNTEIIYTLLLDQKGKILWRSPGVLTEENAEDLANEIARLLK